MNITEFRNQTVEEIRSVLQDVFEDPEGEFKSMNGKALRQFAQDNWGDIEAYMTVGPEVKPKEEETEEVEEDDGEWHGDPKTNLHTGKPGSESQRMTGTKNLA